MKKLRICLLLFMAALLAASCERRPLVDEPYNAIELVLDIEVDVENEGTVAKPTLMTTAFYHPEQLHNQHTEYVGPEGGRVHIGAGQYHLLIYNFDTYSTHVREEHHYNTVEAYTNEVQYHERSAFEALKTMLRQQGRTERGYLDEPVIYEPDHLFVSNIEGVQILSFAESGGRQVIHSSVSTVVKVYNILIGPIQGDNYIANAVVYLTGQAPSVNLSTRAVTGVPSTIYFPIDVNEGQKQFVGTFRTFGQYPGAVNDVYLIVDIEDTGGGRHMWEWDVTDQFEDEGNRTIIIQDEIVVPTPETGAEAGGFNPTVNLWDEQITDIIL